MLCPWRRSYIGKYKGGGTVISNNIFPLPPSFPLLSISTFSPPAFSIPSVPFPLVPSLYIFPGAEIPNCN